MTLLITTSGATQVLLALGPTRMSGARNASHFCVKLPRCQFILITITSAGFLSLKHSGPGAC